MTEMAPEIRVGDRERRDVDALLQDALGDGVLTLSEYDERAAQCWAARTRTLAQRLRASNGAFGSVEIVTQAEADEGDGD